MLCLFDGYSAMFFNNNKYIFCCYERPTVNSTVQILTTAFDCLRKDLLDFKVGAACEGVDRLDVEALECGHGLLQSGHRENKKYI